MEHAPIKGRGSAENIANRFEKCHLAYEPDATDTAEESPAPTTQFYKDLTRSIISTNDSPDVGFESSLNPYRGCEHGCMYCYARPTHEYLGMSAGLDFESKIMVKENAPELLRDALMSRRWKPQILFMSGVTDCYQPVERRMKITRRCLEVLAEFRNPVALITKNALITRDIDVFQELARYNAVMTCLSITTLRYELAGVMEPRAARPKARLEAIRQLHKAGIPVGVNVAPLIPGLTDYEMPAILQQAAEAGVQFAGYTIVRLPYGVKPLFQDWLTRHFPESKEKVLHRLREIRNGKLYDSRFGVRHHGQGTYADQINELFTVAKHKAGIPDTWPALSTLSFQRPHPSTPQLELFANP